MYQKRGRIRDGRCMSHKDRGATSAHQEMLSYALNSLSLIYLPIYLSITVHLYLCMYAYICDFKSKIMLSSL